jgi:hypothetical protein
MAFVRDFDVFSGPANTEIDYSVKSPLARGTDDLKGAMREAVEGMTKSEARRYLEYLKGIKGVVGKHARSIARSKEASEPPSPCKDRRGRGALYIQKSRLRASVKGARV